MRTEDFSLEEEMYSNFHPPRLENSVVTECIKNPLGVEEKRALLANQPLVFPKQQNFLPSEEKGKRPSETWYFLDWY